MDKRQRENIITHMREVITSWTPHRPKYIDASWLLCEICNPEFAINLTKSEFEDLSEITGEDIDVFTSVYSKTIHLHLYTGFMLYGAISPRPEIDEFINEKLEITKQIMKEAGICFCSICGGTKFTKAGTRCDRRGRWQILKCTACRHKQKGELIKAHGGKP